MRSTFAFSKTLAVLLLIPTIAFGANRPGANATNAYFVGMNAEDPTTHPGPVIGAAPTIQPLMSRGWDAGLDWPTLIGGSSSAVGSRPTHSDQSDYTWTNFNTYLNRMAASGTRVIYTLSMFPQWATGNSTDTHCHLAGSRTNAVGSCYPTTDYATTAACQGSLAGTTTDNCIIREFIKDLLTHATANGTPIYALELGNEVNFCELAILGAGSDPTCHQSSDVEFVGTIAQHVAMMAAAKDQARKTQSNIVIYSPSVSALTASTCTGSSATGQEWLNRWLGAGGLSLVDAISFHGYPGTSVEVINDYITALVGCSNITKPLIDTEGSWGGTIIGGQLVSFCSRTTNVNTYTFNQGHFLTGANVGQNILISGTTAGASTSFDGTFAIVSVPDSTHITVAQTAANDSAAGGGVGVLTAQQLLQPDYIARWYLLQFSRGVISALWYQFSNDSWGALCYKFTSSTCSDATPTAGNVAAGEMYKWLADATASGTCATNGTVWTCNYSKAFGYKSQAVWDTSGSSTYTFPVGYTQYRDTTGATNLLSGTTQAIGTTPILLETIPRNGGGRNNR